MYFYRGCVTRIRNGHLFLTQNESTKREGVRKGGDDGGYVGYVGGRGGRWQMERRMSSLIKKSLNKMTTKIDWFGELGQRS